MTPFKRLKDRFRGKSPKSQNESPQSGETGTKTDPTAPASAKSSKSGAAVAQVQDVTVQKCLWQIAYEEISQRERDVLSRRQAPVADAKEARGRQSPTINVVEDVIQTTEKRYQEYQEGGVKLHRSSGKDSDVRGSCQKIINAALSFKDVISAVSAFDPTSHAASAWAVISLGLTMAQNRFDLRDALFESCEYLSDVLARCSHVEKNFWLKNSKENVEVGHAIVRIYKVILQYAAEVLAAQDPGVRRWIMDAVTAVTKQRLAGLQSSIKENEQYLNQWVQFDQHLQHERAAESILAGIDKISTGLQALIQKFNLPIAEGALYDSYANQHEDMCLPDTRTELRKEISEWAESPDGQCIFWLNGMAGTGKSTIARTLAQSFKDKGQLGATFFFKKGESDRDNARRLISTITKQLIAFNRHLAPLVMSAIERDSDIATKSLREQFDALLLQPLLNVEISELIPAVIVIDALDECDREDDIRLLLLLLPEVQKATSLRLRFLLTSRPNLPIGLGFKRISDTHQDLVLHEIPRPVVEHDITLYLEDQFLRIREERSLPLGWPGEDIMKVLVERTVPLFIAAATLCRFVQDKNWSPANRLSALLNDQTKYTSRLGVTYLPVLNQILAGQDEWESQELIEEFKKIVGVIILLATPLSVNALSQLLGMDADDVSNRLNPLHSVLHVPVDLDTPVGLLHLSFRDFLVDAKLKGNSPFWVDERVQHQKITLNCLRVMHDSLKKNICQLPGEGTTLEEISQQTIDRSIPPELQYSCRYWTQHLVQSEDPNKELEDVLSFLNKHFLHWVEVLSVLGVVSEVIEAISRVQTAVSEEKNPELASFLHDARRFILQNRQIADIAPLQIYCSGLIFAPLQSIVRQRNSHQIPGWILRLPEVESQWSAEQQIIEQHHDLCLCVAFSPDGRLLASTFSSGNIKVWQVVSGALYQTIKAHEDAVRSVAFSPDGRLLASTSVDGNIKIWQTATWSLQQTIKAHEGTIFSIAFSSDGQFMASGAESVENIKIWNTETGTLHESFKEHTENVYSVKFSPDGRLLASGSEGNSSLQLWDLTTGMLLRTLEGHANLVFSVAFSPDGKLLASGSLDHSTKLWEVETGVLKQTLKHSQSISAVCFSPNGKLLASGSDDKSIKLWDVATGELKQTLEGHSSTIYSAVFSPDGKLLGSGCDDQTVRLWELSTSMPQESREWHSGQVSSVVRSPNGEVLASGSYDKTIKLWKTATGALKRTLEGHSSASRPVAFSPDGQVLASGSHATDLRLWETATGTLLQKLEGHKTPVQLAAFSSDGQVLASASRDLEIKLWKTTTGTLQRTLEGHSNWIQSMVFSPDGRLLASGSYDYTIKLWDVATGALQQTLEGHEGAIHLIEFSPDGKLLASTAKDYTIRLWRTMTGSQEQKISTPNYADYLYFSRTGPYLETNVGRFELTIPCDYIDPALPMSEPASSFKFEIMGGQWVSLSGERVLWLPPNYRPSHNGVVSKSVIRDGTIVLGHSSGRVTFFEFQR